jgi:hypothetical protein
MHCRIRGASAAAILAAVLAAGGLGAQESIAPPALDIQLSEQHGAQRQRVDRAAREAAGRYAEWLGAASQTPLVIADAPSWRATPAAMSVEAHVAYELARGWLGQTAEPLVVNGIAWYLQSRVVERLYDFAFQNSGHSGEVVWLFGRTVPYEFPLLRMSRWTAGLGRFDRWPGSASGWPATANSWPASLDPPAVRVAAALASLERSLGWPALQGGLHETARRMRTQPVNLAALGEILTAAAGQDAATTLRAFQDQAPADYAIAEVTTGPCPERPCHLTMISVDRAGGVPPQSLVLRVEFADGQHVDARWDGSQPRSFEFESPSAYAAAHLDPERVMLSDRNWLNNDRFAIPATNVSIAKWAARWLIWVQDAMLTYSAVL